MRCENARELLNRRSDGERLAGRAEALALWRHGLGCSACRAEWQRLKQLRQIARHLPSPPPPIHLKARVLAALPETPPLSLPLRRKGTQNMRLKLAGGVLVTAVLIVALMIWPRTHRDTSLAAEVRQALQGVNAWHLKGWKLQNGRPIPWEVWGRRRPFFYREAVGPDLIVDNGTERVALFAPETGTRRHPRRPMPGTVLKTRSMSDSQNVRWSYNSMVAQWQNAGKPSDETADEAIFDFGESEVFMGGDWDSAGDQRYTIDKRSGLPMQYEIRLGKGEVKRTIGFLQARYDDPLPAAVAALPSAPPGYQVYDMTGAVGELPTENTASQDGLTIQLTPLAVDSRGYVLARVQAWIGHLLIENNNPIYLNVSARRWANENSMDPASNYDDRSRPYTEVHWDVLGSGDPNLRSRPLKLFAPLEPLPPGEPLPATLTVTLEVSLMMNSRFRGTLGLVDSQLLTHDMTLTMALPKPTPIPIEQAVSASLPPHWQDRTSSPYGGYENLEAATDLARAGHYGNVIDKNNLDRPHLTRAAEWYEKYLEATNVVHLQLERFDLARLYHDLGNNQRARELLHDYLNERRSVLDKRSLQRLPLQTRSYIEQAQRRIDAQGRQSAEEALRTWAK